MPVSCRSVSPGTGTVVNGCTTCGASIRAARCGFTIRATCPRIGEATTASGSSGIVTGIAAGSSTIAMATASGTTAGSTAAGTSGIRMTDVTSVTRGTIGVTGTTITNGKTDFLR